MKAVTVKQIKDELHHRSHRELMDLCLRLSRFKKENKELITYLLFESQNEELFIQRVKEYIDASFDQINTKSYYYIQKSIRKILTQIKRYIRYSKKKETEIELLMHFCWRLGSHAPPISKSTRLVNVYNRQLTLIEKAMSSLHEDLQYDYRLELENLIIYE